MHLLKPLELKYTVPSRKYVYCKNKIVKISNLVVSTVARNNGDCNLIGHIGCYGYTIQ